MQAKDIKVGEDYAVWRYSRSRYTTPVRAYVVGTVQVGRGPSWNRQTVNAFTVVLASDKASGNAHPITLQSRQFARPWIEQAAIDKAREAEAQREAEVKVTLWEAFDQATAVITADLRLPVPRYTAERRRNGRPPSALTFNVTDLLDAAQRVCSGNGSEVSR